MTYFVCQPITHLGRAYAVGDAFEPMPHEIGQLVAAGCIKEVQPNAPFAAEVVSSVATKPLPPPGRMVKGTY